MTIMLSNLFTKDAWREMVERNDLELSSLDLTDTNSIEMAELADRIPTPSSLDSLLSPAKSHHYPAQLPDHPSTPTYAMMSPTYLQHHDIFSPKQSPSYLQEMACNQTGSPPIYLRKATSPSCVPSLSSPSCGHISSPGTLPPVHRTRCNTWPRVLQNQEFLDIGCDPEKGKPSNPHPYYRGQNYPVAPMYPSLPSPPSQLPQLSEDHPYEDMGGGSAGGLKHKISRRNPWGNFSYADLITQAIQSTPDQRLTLAQIYDWLINNIQYFKEKSDVSTSAGWKNSIRHNLSLHHKFVKIQNEGTGKSSWWTLALESKPSSRIPRRRAASMESNKLKRERERTLNKVKTRLERTHSTGATSTSGRTGLSSTEPSSPTTFFRGFEYRTRTNSSASSESSFRPRASSDASSPSSLMDFQLDFQTQFNPDQSCGETDLDNIHLDNLNIQPGNIIRKYLHPEVKSSVECDPEALVTSENDFVYKHGLGRRLNMEVIEANVNMNMSETNRNLKNVTRPKGPTQDMQKTTHKLTILEPRDSSEVGGQYKKRFTQHKERVTQYNDQVTQYKERVTIHNNERSPQYKDSKQGGIVQYNVDYTGSCDPEDWVEEYNKNIAQLLGCTDERCEREKEMKRQEMILNQIDQLNCSIEFASEEEKKKKQLLVNLLQEMVDKIPTKELKLDGSLSGEDLGFYLEKEEGHHQQTFSLYNQILLNNSTMKDESDVTPDQMDEQMDELTIGQLDETSLRQIERILCL